MMVWRSYAAFCALLLCTAAFCGADAETPDGLLAKNGQCLFPIGFYELPKDDQALRTMAGAGVNLVHCHSPADLDRAQSAGMLGVVNLPLQNGPTDKLREKIESVADHPALAVWEGPDEIVWNFTAYSGLFRKHNVHKIPGAWWRQTDNAVEYAREQAGRIIPNMRRAAAMVREIDLQDRQIWFNEALQSDVYYVRQYLPFVDITGCDIYPVNDHSRDIVRMGPATERWKMVGRGKPVWMVLQAFSWHELGDYHGAGKKPAYPTFEESRFMAYDVIAHGARGILYWGSHYLKSDECRQAVYAVIRELAALQPFLVAREVDSADLEVVELLDPNARPRVQMMVRQAASDWLIVFVNEDDERHMGVVVEGLEKLEGQTMYLLYGSEETTVSHGELITRMQPLEVKVFATDRKWETSDTTGRDYRD